MRTLTFNNAATAAIQGRSGAKLRMDVKDGTLMIKPTDRKAGPHVLTEIEAKGKSGIQVQISEKQLEKLGAAELLADASTFSLVPGKYGWYALQAGEPGELAVADGEVAVAAKGE